LANPLLNVINLNVFYGDAQALWDVNFQIQEGEVFSIIGSNGAGKSTILKTLSGLLSPASGAIEFLRFRIDGKTPASIVNLGTSIVKEEVSSLPSPLRRTWNWGPSRNGRGPS
jgi:branched-chain amino acid transport system ATP-binding protein